MNYSIIAFSPNDTVKHINKRMSEQGILLDKISIIRYNADCFKETYEMAQKSDINFIIGGIGIGAKGLVKKTLSTLLDRPLVENKKAKEAVEWQIKQNSLKNLYDKTTEQYALYPDGFDCFSCNFGLECGASCDIGRKTIVLLPELEQEAINIFNDYILNYFKKKRSYESKVLKFKLYGADNVEINVKLAQLKKSKMYSVLIESDYTTDSMVTFIFGKSADKEFIDELISEFCGLFKEAIYADEDITLSEKAVRLLTVRHKTVGTAESFTGGLISSKIVEVSGASEVFKEGAITYSNESKCKRLKVSSATLAKYGAVSNETAYEMALGVLTMGSDYAITSTGIAGPGGGSAEKPVGLCFLAIGSSDGIHVYERLYYGNRNEIREQATNDALFKLIKLLG
ncbi:MAG: nicotinamide-nucleotide amidohydrolase family protein [Clostridia bacterium]